MKSGVTKFSLILSFISIFFISTTSAQVELFGFGGYMTYSGLQVSKGTVSFDDGPNYGFGLDVEIDRGMLVELNYTHQQTFARLVPYNGITTPLFDMNTHYFQLGAQYEFRKTSKQRAFPFALFTVGATLFDAKDASLDDAWRFSLAFGGGSKFYLAKNLGLRLQGRILMPMTFSGGGMWCGTGGCSVGVGTWATVVQFDFTAGVFLRLGK